MAGNPDLFDNPQASEGDDVRAPSPFSGEKADAVRAKIGRPAGARNKRSVDVERWYFARGYVDPLQRLGELISEDPRVLVAWFEENAGVDHEGKPRPGPSILEVVRMQIAAAGELMPYLHGKKPTEIVVPQELLPMLVIAAGTNQLAEAAKIVDGRAVLSIGSVMDANENKDLAEGDK